MNGDPSETFEKEGGTVGGQGIYSEDNNIVGSLGFFLFLRPVSPGETAGGGDVEEVPTDS